MTVAAPTFPLGQEVVWRPSADAAAKTRLARFIAAQGLADLAGLNARAAEDPGWFWDAVITDLGIRFRQPYTRVVDLSGGIQFPTWCVGGRMNIVESCLEKWIDAGEGNRVAVRFEGEEGVTRLLTYRDLDREVRRLASAMRADGLGPGDAIGLFMPMTPEIVIAFLAIARIGGVILPLFSGYGPGAVAARLRDAGAKALFTADGLYRRGRAVDLKAVADEAVAGVASVRRVVVVPRIGHLQATLDSDRDVWWADYVAGSRKAAPPADTAAEDVVMIIYTSGTTGAPKGAVHTHCGFPIKAAQDMAHGFDIGPSDTLFWMTDMGWMMGPWEVFGVLILGGSMLLFDGAPDYPGVDRVWQLVEDHGVTCLGLSPTFVRSIMPHGTAGAEARDLSSLRSFGSTGEAWNLDPWLWLFEAVGGRRVPILNYSGGTEISGGILMGNLMGPAKPCAFTGPAPGMAADVVDEAGNPVRGTVGELVIRAPWIGMTRGFWKDPERYLATYWSRLPNVWVHGDFAMVDEDGLWYILGRSDDTIKVAGKRVGPAEVESVLVGHSAVVEAAAIGVPDPVKGQAIVAFAVLGGEAQPTADLGRELRELVARELGKPLTPKAVHFVADIPKTRNAKVMRRVIRAAYLGEDPGDLSALVNPEAVAAIGPSGSQ